MLIGGSIVIEIIYKNEDENLLKDDNIKLPKNIRQIGEGNSDYQIYVEDNVMNYLKKVPTNQNDIRYGVLLGTVKKAYGYTYVFVSGAVDVEDIVENTVIFSDEIWTNINDNIHRYFRNTKIVGWFTSLNYQINNDMPYITKLHLDNFAGNDKIYLKLDRTEDEENFYVYGSNSLLKLPGYHIYFEKNIDMDDYVYGSNVQSRFIKECNKKDNKKEITGKQNSNKNGREKNGENIIRKSFDTPKYGIEENSKKNNTGYDNMARKLSRNIASVLLVFALFGTVAVVSNESAMKNIKSKIMDIVSGGSNNQDNIPVNGIINEPTELETTTQDNEENNSTKGASDGNVIVIGQVTTGDPSINNQSETNETTTKQEVTEQTTKIGEGENQTTTNATGQTRASENQSSTEVTASVEPNERAYYIVEKGDTLYSIAVKLYNDPDKMNDIISLNNITNINYVEEGKKLLLP